MDGRSFRIVLVITAIILITSTAHCQTPSPPNKQRASKPRDTGQRGDNVGTD